MKKIVYSIFCILVVAFFVRINSAQWQSVETAGNDYFVTYLIKDTSRVVFAANNQIFTKDGKNLKKLSSCKNQLGEKINCILNPTSMGTFKDNLFILSLQQILFSSDNGDSWSETGFTQTVKTSLPKAEKNNAVYFTEFSTTSDYIYVIGMKYRASRPYGSMILRSRDLISWEEVKTKFVPAAKLLSIAFVNDQTGWAVGQNGVVLHTVNGGINWLPQTSGIRAIDKTNLNDVHFVDKDRGWAVGDNGVILTTVNGGITWAKQTSTTKSSLLKINFVNERIGWVIGNKGTVLQTVDGGKTWTAFNQGANDLYGIYSTELRPDASNPQSNHWISYVVGANGTVLKGCSSQEICDSTDLLKFERKLSENIEKERERLVTEQATATKNEKKRRDKDNEDKVKRLRDNIRKQYKKVDVEYDEESEAIKLSGKVNGFKEWNDVKERAELVLPIKKNEIDYTEIPIVVITDNLKTDNLRDIGTLDYSFLTSSQSNQLMCKDTAIRYSRDKIEIKKSNEDYEDTSYTDRAKQVEKTSANRCFKFSNDQYLLSTKNGVFLYKKSGLLSAGKWNLITPIFPMQKLLIREEGVFETSTHFFILASVFTDKIFDNNIIFRFSKSKPDKIDKEKEIFSKAAEYIRIVSPQNGTLEIVSKNDKSMISKDNGNTWKEK